MQREEIGMDKRNRINSIFIFLFSLKNSASLRLCVLILLFSFLAQAQDFPKEIRGYKVHRADVLIKTSGEKALKKEKREALVTVGEPALEDISLTGVTFELSAEIDAVEQSGKVDFLTFYNFKVNGLSVEIEEYKESFSFEKNQPIKLPKPVKIFVGAGQTLRGAVNEIKDSKDEWIVTGRIFVFGKFKKMGFNFKRVIPVDVNIKIKNPLKSITTQNI